MGTLSLGGFTLLQTRLNTATNLLQGPIALTQYEFTDDPFDIRWYALTTEGITAFDINGSFGFFDIDQEFSVAGIGNFALPTDIQVGSDAGNLWLVASARNSSSLTTFSIDPATGELAQAEQIVDTGALIGVTQIATVNVGAQMFVIAASDPLASLAAFSVGNDGSLTKTDFENAGSLPLNGVKDVAVVEGGDPSRFVTVSGEGIALWQVDASGQIGLLDDTTATTIPGSPTNTVTAGEFSRLGAPQEFVITGIEANRKLAVLEIVNDELVERSVFDLQAAGFFGSVSHVSTSLIEGVRLVTAITSVGEIFILGMSQDGTLNIAQSLVWQVDTTAPIHSARDVSLVGIGGNCFLVVGGTQSVSNISLHGQTMFIIGNDKDNLTGTGADDDLFGFARNDVLTGEGGDDRLFGGLNKDTLFGGADTDMLYGSWGDDQLFGGNGDDLLSGGEDDDLLRGGSGNDRLSGGKGADDMDGGSGVNYLDYTDSAAGVTIDLLASTASGGDATGDTFANIQNVDGSAKDDSLTGDNLKNLLTGGLGDDMLFGKGGNDTLYGNRGADSLFGGAGNDFLDAGGAESGVDTLRGDAGNDVLMASAGFLNSFGGAGDDTIHIGTGKQSAFGQAGADTFVLRDSEVTGIDRIRDFELGIDRIDLSNLTEVVIDSFADFQANTIDTALGARLTIGVNRYIRFDGILESQLTEDHFVAF